MYRVNSISKQLVRLNVIEGGKAQLVDLLPKNFVFTESVTDQMRMLEKAGVIRVREAKVVNANAPKAQTKPVIKEQPEMEGKIDLVPDDKVAKVQKKKK